MASLPFNFPDSPTLNQQVTALGGIIYVWDGVKWISGASPLVPFPPANAIVQSAVPPTTLTNGTLWLDSAGLKLYVLFSGAWVGV